MLPESIVAKMTQPLTLLTGFSRISTAAASRMPNLQLRYLCFSSERGQKYPSFAYSEYKQMTVKWKQHLILLTGLLAFSIVIRFPWFFMDIIDRDESVFILVGKYLSQGHLPYTVVWDIKPPLGFIFFAAATYIFNDSLIAIRIGGAVLVAISAYLVFVICGTFTKVEHALVSAIFTIIGLSLLVPSAHCVTMEHVAIVPLLTALALIIRNPSAPGYILIGVLLGTATLVRTNLGYVAIIVFLAAALIPSSQDKYTRLKNMFRVGAGGILVLLITMLPYAMTGYLSLFLTSVFLVPIDYSIGALSYAEVGKSMVQNAVRIGSGKIFLLYQLSLWLGGLVGLLFFSGSAIWRGKPLSVIWLVIFILVTLASILSCGHPWGHYLLQLVPFFAIGVGLLLSLLFSFQAIKRLSIAPIYAVVFISLLVMCRHTIRDTIGQLKNYGMNGYGPNYAVAEYLKDKLGPNDTLFVTHDILTYWILQKTPLVPIAEFPRNIFDDSITKHLYGPSVTSEHILEDIMNRNPTVIVLAKNSEFEHSDVFIKKLNKNYFLYKEVASPAYPAYRSWRPFLADHDRLIFWNKHSVDSSYD